MMVGRCCCCLVCRCRSCTRLADQPELRLSCGVWVVVVVLLLLVLLVLLVGNSRREK